MATTPKKKAPVGCVKGPRYPTTDNDMPLLEGCAAGEHNPPGQPGHSVHYLVHFSPSLSKCPPDPSVLWPCPGLLPLLCSLNTKAEQAPSDEAFSFSHLSSLSGGVLHAWDHQQTSATPGNTCASAALCAHLCYTGWWGPALQTREGKGGLNSSILWEQSWYWKDVWQRSTPRYSCPQPALHTPAPCGPRS